LGSGVRIYYRGRLIAVGFVFICKEHLFVTGRYTEHWAIFKLFWAFFKWLGVSTLLWGIFDWHELIPDMLEFKIEQLAFPCVSGWHGLISE
jgi:hypothetical protein